MLPSCGHFKNIPCPFFKFALCVRPHCPYRHQNTENAQQRQLFAPTVDETESLFDSKVELDNIINKTSYHDNVIERQDNATYIPTPMDSGIKPQGILKTSSNMERPSTSYVPEYKPTPISKLKEITTIPVKSSKSVYTPEFPIAVRKRKNVEEYDPTEVKCIPKKTVTFVEETDSPTDVPLILIDSSEEEIDDGEIAPAFSDDDFEDDVIPVSNTTQKVPDVITVKEEIIEEEKVDEFSVVDKILVDCKKNEMFLSSFKKIHPSKTNNLSSKVQKQDTDRTILPQKADIKKSTSTDSAKVDKNISSNNKTDNSSSKPKDKKYDIADCVKSFLVDENSDHIIKKETKSEKKEIKSEKHKKNSSSHSSHGKEKLKNDSKEVKSKHIKTNSDSKKSSDSKSTKSHKHSVKESSDKKDFKKKGESNCAKHKEGSTSPSKKKDKHNSLKSSESHTVKSKEKTLSNDHSIKRKSSALDSESNRNASKSKSLPEKKKIKSDFCVSPLKQPKSENSPAFASDDSNSGFDDSAISDSDPDEECRRIFEECYPEESNSVQDGKQEVIEQPKSTKSSDLVIMRKKRYAHAAASEIKPPSKKPKAEIKRLLNPAQVMHNRFAQHQPRFGQLNENKDSGKDKKRISFVPNQSLLAAVKNKNQFNPALANFSPLPSTVSKTLKVTQRTAHIPEVAMKPRPIIPADYGSKVPANIRQKFLNAFIDECLKFSPSEDEAYDLALEEEKKVYDRSSSRPLYLNVAANALKRLRRQAEEGPTAGGNSISSNNSASNYRTVSHETVLNGPLAQRRSFSIGKKKEAPEIKGGAELYEYLLQYVLTPEQVKENSYPLPHSIEKDRAVIEGAYATRTLYCNDAFKRMCSRCHKTYYVNVDGDYVRDEECDFHWGRLWKKRIAGNFESRYSCCQGDAESDGCCVSPGHVFDGSENHVLKGYVRTLPKTPPRDKCYGIFALDCEMCYTTAGMELTRVTVVDENCKTVYETFVKPAHTVLDYNTRFSGITEDDLKNVRTSIIDVQAVLLCLFNDKTILIGHSLESDFKALKLFHKTVIDTSVVFPHKSGLPYKRALKTLMAEKLNKIIQNDVGGHDSQEDAVACMELMLWKVKEDARGNR